MNKFARTSSEVDLEPMEWAAYILLRDAKLRNPKESDGRKTFFDAAKRTLDLDSDEIFEERMQQMRARREEQIRYIVGNLETDGRPNPQLEALMAYKVFAGKAECKLDIAIANWRMSESELFEMVKSREQLQHLRASEIASPNEIDEMTKEVNTRRHEAEKNWKAWRRELQTYINRIRLASLIIERRDKSGLSQENFARWANVSAATIKNIESIDEPGRGFSPKTLRLIEEALGWQAGSISAISTGKDPIEDPSWPPASMRVGEVEDSDFIQLPEVTENQLAIRLSGNDVDLLRAVAVQESRNINAVIADATGFYARYHLEVKESS